jgi:predicted transcriptional regulator of viral defense system
VGPSADRRDLRRRLLGLAFGQAGYFSAAQAKEIGYSYQAQKYNADAGNWIRVDRGIFRLPDWPDGPWDSLVRWTLWSGGRGVVSHESALAVLDLSDVDPVRVHLTVPDGFGARHTGVVLHHGHLEPADVDTRDGFSVTSPVRTLLDVAAGQISQEHVDNAVHEAAERGLISIRRLRDRADDAGDRAALRIERALAARS